MIVLINQILLILKKFFTIYLNAVDKVMREYHKIVVFYRNANSSTEMKNKFDYRNF